VNAMINAPLPIAAGISSPLSSRVQVAAMLALIGVLVLWEAWLAPIRPGGSWLLLKVLPLCAAVPGLLRRDTRTSQWLTLLLPLYVAEGIVRAWSEPGRVRAFASAEIVLAVTVFVAAIAMVRSVRRNEQRGAGGTAGNGRGV